MIKKALIILYQNNFFISFDKKNAMMIEYTEGIYNFYFYILTNKNKTVLYTGVTNSLKRRLHEHRDKLNPKSFTARYNVEFLVYYEHFTWIQLAIAREKEIKNLLREKKLDLIKEFNPEFEFLNSHFE
jgi:putative endonuclease